MRVIDNKFAVIETLGAGSIGQVFKVQDISNDKIYALKSLLPISDRPISELKEEFELLAQLRHPFLVRVYDYGIDADGRPYFTMDYISGGSLKSRAAGIESDDLFRFSLMILSALDYIHSRGLLHGDLKPANILFDETGNVKLVDFGLARYLRGNASRGRSGTLEFAAPEILKREMLSPSSDLYSFGVLLFEMLYGRPLFSGSASEIISRKLEKSPELPWISDGLGGEKMRGYLSALLASNPQNRPSSAGQAARMLKAVLRPIFRGDTDTGRYHFDRAPFCGRDKELGKLYKAFEGQKNGHSSCIAIVGEPGVGKSRLLEQFKYHVQTNGGRFVESGYAIRENRPFGSLLDAVKQLTIHYDPERKLLDEKAPELKRLFRKHYEDQAVGLDLLSGRQLLIESLASYIIELATGKNLTLVLEDVDAADELSLDAIISIAGRLHLELESSSQSRGINFIITFQPLPSLEHRAIENGFDIIQLKSADGELWRSYLQALFGDFSPPTEFAEKLLGETGGNFLFAEESLKVLVDVGVLIRQTGNWKLNIEKLNRFPLPRTVIEAVKKRMEILDPALLVLVETASVLEQWFEGGILLSLAGFKSDEIKLLDDLVDLRILRRNNGDFSFIHNQVKEVIYSSLTARKKAALHAKSAAYYESQNADPEILCRHFLAAEDYGKAYDYLLLSAERAISVFAWSQAIRYYEQIIDMLPRWKNAPARGLFVALSGAGKAMMFVDPKKAKEYLEKAEKAADAGNDDRYQAKILLAENWQHLGDNESALRLYADILKNAGDYPQILAECNLGIGFVFNKMGRLDEAAKSFMNALDLFVDNPEKLCRVLGHLGIICKRKGDFDGALDFYGRALDVCLHYDYRWTAMNLHGNIANIYSARGEYQKALESYQKSLDLARRISDRRIEGINLLNIGHLLVLLGRMAEAINHFSNALQIQKGVGDRSSQAVTFNNLGEVHLNLGQFKKALEYYEKGRSLAKQIKEPRIELANIRGLADTNLVLGDLKTAAELTARSISLAEEIGDQEQKAWAEAQAAEIDYERGNKIAGVEKLQRIFDSEPKDTALKARCLLLAARIEIDNDNMVKAESYLRQLSSMELPSGIKAGIFYYQAIGHLNRESTMTNLQRAEDTLLRALTLAEKFGPARLRPLCWLALSRIRKMTRGDGKKELAKAQSLADGFCIGLPENVRRLYLEKFKFVEEDSLSVKDDNMEKSNREKRIETLLEVSKSINSILELDPLLNRVMDLVLENLQGERGFIILRENSGGFEPVVARNIDKENILGELTISRSTIEDVFNSGRPLLMNRAPDETSDRESVVDFNIMSIMCAPLILRDKPMGIVYIDNRFGGRAFDSEDLEFLQGFCNLASIAIENARLTTNLSARNLYLQKQIEKASGFGNIIGKSPGMQKVFRMAEAVAATDATVVLTGESGTGKEILARAIHFSGPRKTARFIPVDCGALPETLLETELFGHKKGAFTGAVSDKPGLFEEADGGTIFLDEITNTTQNFQVKLLRVIQEGEFRRVGDSKARKVNVRIISATNKDLSTEVAEGRFREDLYYRLNVVNIRLPALRERKEDIPILAEYFLDNICKKMKIPKKTLSPRALDYLINYRWPGNVRQLENIMERMVIFSESGIIDVDDLPQEIRSIIDNLSDENKAQFAVPKTKVELKMAKAELERLFLIGILEQAGGNIMQAARISGVDRTQLHHMLNKLKINIDNFRNKNND